MKKLFLACSLVLVGIIGVIGLTGCSADDLQNGLSLLTASSASYTCAIENCTDTTHAHSACDFDGCMILNDHNHESHEQCTEANCTETRPHQHGKCGIGGCSNHGTHAHGQDGHNKGSHSHNNHNGSHH